MNSKPKVIATAALPQICSLREGLLKEKNTDQSTILPAAALGCLHGPLRSALARSREIRRWSSCSGDGVATIAQTRGSPRFQASRVRSKVSPSMASVFARRRRRGTAIDAASTNWLSIRFASSRRCTQKPSNLASWTTTIPTGAPATCSALVRKRASRPSNPGRSP
jgi:hypothetical protein